RRGDGELPSRRHGQARHRLRHAERDQSAPDLRRRPQVGPDKGTAAFDGMIQAMSGLMSITGFPSNGPTRVGFAGADVMSGFTAAFGVASALYQRTHTGKGQLV